MTDTTAGKGERRSPVKFAHAVLKTRDNFAEMREFYRLALDAEIVFENDRCAFVRFDEEHHRLLIVHSPNSEVPTGDTIGLDHLAYTFGSLADLIACYDRMAESGMEPYVAINHGVTHAIYYKDPDGNRVELQVDNFESMAEATDFLTGTYGVNPIGTGFDVEAYRKRLEAGEDEMSILRPARDYVPEPPSDALFAQLKS